ncbi:MAG: hypothetical protein WKH64_03755 [Chloroflexia bacterium]
MNRRRRPKSFAERILPFFVLIMVAVLVLSLLAQTCAPGGTITPGV